MKLLFFVTSIILFFLASTAPYPIDKAITPAERHVIKHSHEVNCLNCFCGHHAIERALHECSPDRDLVLCPPSIVNRICYRCSCYPRIPVSPSPLIMKPHSDDHKRDNDDHKRDDDDHKRDDDDRKLDGDDHKRDDDDHKRDDDDHKRDDEDHKRDDDDHKHDEDDGHDEMITPTPDEENLDMDKPHPKSSMPKKSPKPSRKPKPSTTPTMTPSPKACATFERGGGGGNTRFDVNLVRKYGTFKVSWQMDSVPDKVEIFYEGRKIFTTKVPVSGRGSAYVKYAGNSSVITVWVSSPTTGTGWFLKIGCPVSH